MLTMRGKQFTVKNRILRGKFNGILLRHYHMHYRLLGKSLTFMDQLQMHFINVVKTRSLDILLKYVATW